MHGDHIQLWTHAPMAAPHDKISHGCLDINISISTLRKVVSVLLINDNCIVVTKKFILKTYLSHSNLGRLRSLSELWSNQLMWM